MDAITLKQFHRAMIATPLKEEVTTNIHIVKIDGKDISFQWSEADKAWYIMNRVLIEPHNYKIVMYCPECESKQDFTINKALEKVRCGECKTVYSFCL